MFSRKLKNMKRKFGRQVEEDQHQSSNPAYVAAPGTSVSITRSPFQGEVDPLIRLTLRKNGELVPGLVSEVVYVGDTISIQHTSTYYDGYVTAQKTASIRLAVHESISTYSLFQKVQGAKVYLWHDGRESYVPGGGELYPKDTVNVTYTMDFNTNTGRDRQESTFQFSVEKV